MFLIALKLPLSLAMIIAETAIFALSLAFKKVIHRLNNVFAVNLIF